MERLVLNMICGYTHDDILRYRDGALSDRKRHSFDHHLDSCKRCRESLYLLNSIEKTLSQERDPESIIPDAAMNAFGIQTARDDGKRLLRRQILPGQVSKWLLPSLSFMLVLVLLTVFWSPLTSGISQLISNKYQTPLSGSNDLVPARIDPSPSQESRAAVPPPETPLRTDDSPQFAIYKASIPLREVYENYSSKPYKSGESIEAPPYESIRISEIPFEEEPLLTEAAIDAYYQGTLIFKLPDRSVYDSLAKRCLDASPVPIVIAVDGKAVAWGTFMHPISSMTPPMDSFLLYFPFPEKPEKTESYFKLYNSGKEQFDRLEKLILAVFTYEDKLKDGSEAPQDLFYEMPYGITGSSPELTP